MLQLNAPILPTDFFLPAAASIAADSAKPKTFLGMSLVFWGATAALITVGSLLYARKARRSA